MNFDWNRFVSDHDEFRWNSWWHMSRWLTWRGIVDGKAYARMRAS